MEILTLEDIKKAKERISGYIRRTPLWEEGRLEEFVGCKLYLKPENLQLTGAFKIRGALNTALSLSKDELEKGIITSSSGNHAQACAYVGRMLGIHATVVIPEDAPKVKINNAKRMGAEVILWDRSYAKRWEKVYEEEKLHGYIPIHPYEEPRVMAGQGTIGLEILEDLPDVQTVVVPIGGGGLISGISTAIKETNPNIRVIGIQAAASCPYYASRMAGKPTPPPFNGEETLADGISCTAVGKNPYPIIEKYVDEIVTVEEDSIKQAVKLIADKAKFIVEPTSAVVIAAFLEKKFKVDKDEKVCALLTSGNYDIDKLGKIYNDEEVSGVKHKK